MNLESLSQFFSNQPLPTAETPSSYLPEALPDLSTEQIALITASVALAAIACLVRSCKNSSPDGTEAYVATGYQAKLPAGPPKKTADCKEETHGHSIKISTQPNLLRIKVSGESSSLPQTLNDQADRTIKAWVAPFLDELRNSSTAPCRKQFTVSSIPKKEDRYIYEIYFETVPKDLSSEQVGYELKILRGASLFKFFASKGDHGDASAGVRKPRQRGRKKTQSWAARQLKSVTGTAKKR